MRALIIDADDDVLLIRVYRDGLDKGDGFWANPGGGIEPDETPLEALQRELREETGLQVEHLGPEIWTTTVLRPTTHWDGRLDHIHLYRTGRFDPTPEQSKTQLEAEGIREMRWWSPDELQTQGHTFHPRLLPELLTRLHQDGVPPAPIQLNG